MARFINKQEEVIQLELTPHGKKMFSEGKLMPRYYAFYDDDILYDNEYQPSGSIQKSNPKISEEKQNNIVSRIKDTPRLEIYSDRGWAKNYRSFEGSGDENNDELTNIASPNPNQATPASSKFLRALGKNNPVQIYAPAWQIKTMADSQILSVSGTEEFPYQGGASGSELIVPFISSSLPLEYDIAEMRVNLSNGVVVPPGEGNEVSRDLWELTKDGRLLLDVQEINSLFKGNGNFDIEVFKAPTSEEGNQQTLSRLMFINDKFENALNIVAQEDPDEYARVLSGDDENMDRNIPKLDTSYVEYYLSIRVDDEIEDLEKAPEVGETIYKTAIESEPIDPCEEP